MWLAIYPGWPCLWLKMPGLAPALLRPWRGQVGLENKSIDDEVCFEHKYVLFGMYSHLYVGNMKICCCFADLWNALMFQTCLCSIISFGPRGHENRPVSPADPYRSAQMISAACWPLMTFLYDLSCVGEEYVPPREPVGKRGMGWQRKIVCLCAFSRDCTLRAVWSPACAHGIDWVSDCLQTASLGLLRFTVQEQPEDNEDEPPEPCFYSLKPLCMAKSEWSFHTWTHIKILWC